MHALTTKLECTALRAITTIKRRSICTSREVNVFVILHNTQYLSHHSFTPPPTNSQSLDIPTTTTKLKGYRKKEEQESIHKAPLPVVIEQQKTIKITHAANAEGALRKEKKAENIIHQNPPPISRRQHFRLRRTRRAPVPEPPTPRRRRRRLHVLLRRLRARRTSPR